MKILIVRTFPSIMNFKQYNVQEIGLAKALVRKGYECGIVFYNGKSKDEIEYIPVECNGKIRNITVYKLHGYSILKNGFFPSLRKITKEYDVIQVHEYDQITSWLYYAWSRKKVVIYHGPYYDKFNRRYNLKCKVFDNLFLRIKHNRKVLCITKSHAAEEFLRSKGFKNVKSVGVGLDSENFQANLSTCDEISVQKDKFNLLYVGKIEPRRNTLFLAEVMTTTLMMNSQIHCIIVGTGEQEYKEQFIQKVQPLIETGRLTYYESASQFQLADLYSKVQLMIFPSVYEIFGMVLLEALYFNLPIISSKNGGADMIIKDGKNGFIIPDFNVNTWIEKIENLYQSENLYSSLKECLFEMDKEELSWNYISDKFCEVYEQVN